MAYRHVDLLRVLAWGEPVGALAPAGRGGLYVFEYEPSWRRRRPRVELAAVLMPLDARRATYTFPNASLETYHGLPPMIADSLPDRFGNQVIAAALAREGVHVEDITPLDRLAYVGGRGMGALTFQPDLRAHQEAPTSLALAELVETARAAVQGSLAEDERSEALAALLAVGSSAGGARAKAIVAWNRETNEIRAGGIDTPEGFEQWLLKFDGVENVDKGTSFGASHDFGRIEYAYSRMARDAGIAMSETHLLHEGGRSHFMTRRFDRPAGDARLHLQTLCALDMLDYNATATNDYASLILRAIALADDEEQAEVRQEVFRRLVFNQLASNCDDHTKNHSFLCDSQGRWRLSPAYDLTFAYDARNRWLHQHLMSVEGKFAGVDRGDLIRFADRFQVPAAASVIGQVEEALSHWEGYAEEAEVSAEWRRLVRARLDEVALNSTSRR